MGFAALGFVTPAWCQGNLDAGKSPARIFSDTCAGCHRNVREVKRTNAGFLRTHYTTGPVEANAMANYLASVGNEPREPRPAPAPAAAAQRPLPPAEVTPELAPALVAPPRQPQPKAAQAPASKKGRVVAEPRGAPPALIITDASSASDLPELPLPPPPAPPPALLLEPFEE